MEHSYAISFSSIKYHLIYHLTCTCNYQRTTKRKLKFSLPLLKKLFVVLWKQITIEYQEIMRINKLQCLNNCKFLPYRSYPEEHLIKGKAYCLTMATILKPQNTSCVVILVQKILKYTCSSKLKDFFSVHTTNSYLLLVLICRYCISQTFPQNFMDSKLRSLNSLKSRRTSEVYFKMLQKRKRKFQFKFCWPIFVWQNFSRARLCENEHRAQQPTTYIMRPACIDPSYQSRPAPPQYHYQQGL